MDSVGEPVPLANGIRKDSIKDSMRVSYNFNGTVVIVHRHVEFVDDR